VSAPWRIDRAVPGSPAPAGFEALGARVNGRVDTDPAEGTTRWVAHRAGQAVARLSTLVADGLHGAPGRSGLVGHYDALKGEAGVSLLRAAREELAEAGVLRVLGPMNGSTWRRYRLALPAEPGDPTFEPPVFLGEPRNPFEYPSQFEEAGFTVSARYESRIEPAVRLDEARLGESRARLAAAGIRVRALDPARFEQEIRSLFALSLESFADNLYYTPIAFEEFRATCEAVLPILDPSLVLLAEDASGRLVGYIFGYPDPLSDQGAGPARAVAKTVAVSPSARRVGVGAALLDALRDAAVRRGTGSMIHALMHVKNPSMRMSFRHESEIFRRYALYEWTR
jgi:ribosomal protein S18 acetylase RimI-like enzyme